MGLNVNDRAMQNAEAAYLEEPVSKEKVNCTGCGNLTSYVNIDGLCAKCERED